MRAAKIDGNQAEIVAALKDVGASVQSLASIGKGCPDLLVGFQGGNFLMEIKDGELSRSRQALTGLQVIWHRSWCGRVYVVENVAQALKILGIYDKS